MLKICSFTTNTGNKINLSTNFPFLQCLHQSEITQRFLFQDGLWFFSKIISTDKRETNSGWLLTTAKAPNKLTMNNIPVWMLTLSANSRPLKDLHSMLKVTYETHPRPVNDLSLKYTKKKINLVKISNTENTTKQYFSLATVKICEYILMNYY